MLPLLIHFLVAIGTLIYDEKLIHGRCRSAHIEDVSVHPDYQGQGFGKSLISFLVQRAKDRECYKVSLRCKESLRKFYEKNLFVQKDINMELRFA